MRAKSALLDPTDLQGGRSKVYVLPERRTVNWDARSSRLPPVSNKTNGIFMHFVLETPHFPSTRSTAYLIFSSPKSTLNLIAVYS